MGVPGQGANRTIRLDQIDWAGWMRGYVAAVSSIYFVHDDLALNSVDWEEQPPWGVER